MMLYNPDGCRVVMDVLEGCSFTEKEMLGLENRIMESRCGKIQGYMVK